MGKGFAKRAGASCDQDRFAGEIDHAGFEIIETLDKEGWILIACKIKGAF